MTAPAAPGRGPRCAAALPADAQWCGLCWADLRPPPPPPPAAPPAYGAAPGAGAPALRAAPAAYGDPLTSPLEHLQPSGPAAPSPLAATGPGAVTRAGADPGAAPAWPCTRCGAANPLEADACLACSAPFLAAERRGARGVLVLPLVGDVMALGRSQRLLLATAVAIAIIALTALLALLA